MSAPATTVFGHPLRMPAGFEEESIYTFVLEEAAAPSLRGRAGAGAPAAFRPNVVVTRQRTAASLAAFVAEQRRLLAERATAPVYVREGSFQIAGLPAHEAEVLLKGDGASAGIYQWQVAVLRDGFAYGFFCTTSPDRWPKDRERFRALLAGWS